LLYGEIVQFLLLHFY